MTDVLNQNKWATIINEAKIINNNSEEFVIELPGSEILNKKFDYRVHFGESPNYLPNKIIWLEPDGNPMKTLEIKYKKVSGKPEYIPCGVQISVRLGGVLVGELDVAIEAFETNITLPPDVFTIDYSSAEIVWDSDIELFIRQKGGIPRTGVDFALGNDYNNNVQPIIRDEYKVPQQNNDNKNIEINTSNNQDEILDNTVMRVELKNTHRKYGNWVIAALVIMISMIGCTLFTQYKREKRK